MRYAPATLKDSLSLRCFWLDHQLSQNVFFAMATLSCSPATTSYLTGSRILDDHMQSTSLAANFDGMRRYKWAVRRAMNETSHFADALGVVLFAVLRVMSVYLLLIAVVSLFVLRDELGGLLPKGPQSHRGRITPERKE